GNPPHRRRGRGHRHRPDPRGYLQRPRPPGTHHRRDPRRSPWWVTPCTTSTRLGCVAPPAPSCAARSCAPAGTTPTFGSCVNTQANYGTGSTATPDGPCWWTPRRYACARFTEIRTMPHTPHVNRAGDGWPSHEVATYCCAHTLTHLLH